MMNYFYTVLRMLSVHVKKKSIFQEMLLEYLKYKMEKYFQRKMENGKSYPCYTHK